jgi:ABC-type branched-subunit amino acid transport system substrate-binding protein
MAVRTCTETQTGWRALALAAVAALLLAGCSSEEDTAADGGDADGGDGAAAEETADGGSGEEGPVKLGALLPMTGDLQAYGQPSRNGIELAAMEINDADGLLGRELSIVVGDTQTKPQAGTDAAKKLVSIEGVSGIVGALSSGVTIPVARSVTSKEGVAQISGASTSPVITDLDDNDFLFRTVPSDAFQGKALAEVVAGNDVGNVAVMYVNNDYGEGLANSFTEAFEANGGTVTASGGYEKGNASYRGELSSLSEGEPAALVLIGYPQNGTTILRQAIEGGHFDQFVFTDGLKAPEIIESIGAEALEGSYGTAPQATDDTPSAMNFRSAYEAEYGEVPPKPFIDTAYDATYLLALAAQAAGSDDPEAVRDHLREVANPPGTEILPGEWAKAREALANGEDILDAGASGSVDFDDNGDVGGSFAHWAIRDGKIETVEVLEPGE